MNKPGTPPTSQAYIALFSENAPSWMAFMEEEWGRQTNQLSTLQGDAALPPAGSTLPPLADPGALPMAWASAPPPVVPSDTTLLGWLDGTPAEVLTTPPVPTTSTQPEPGETGIPIVNASPSQPEDGAEVQAEAETHLAHAEGEDFEEPRHATGEHGPITDASPLPDNERAAATLAPTEEDTPGDPTATPTDEELVTTPTDEELVTTPTDEEPVARSTDKDSVARSTDKDSAPRPAGFGF